MKKSCTYIILSLTITVFVLTGCRSHNRIASQSAGRSSEFSTSDESSSSSERSSSYEPEAPSSSTASSETATSEAFSLETASSESASSEAFFSEAQTEKERIAKGLPAEGMSKTLHIHDILVPEIPALRDVPFMQADIETITLLADGAKPEKKESTRRADGRKYSDGHFIYWRDNGVVYVTHSSGPHLVSVILEKDGLSLNCGLITGMAETDVRQIPLPFKQFEKKDMFDGMNSIAFQSSFFNNADSPFYTENFDSSFVYVGAVPDEEIMEYEIGTSSCISIVALVKDGYITHIILDMPTAG